jgi:hypothetical protein
MSDVNLDFTVNNNSIEFTVEPNDITITPTDIQLTFFNAAQPTVGGSTGELQYNANGQFGGIPSANYNGSNLTFQLANTKITGGNNHYYLQTDGTGNLTWAVGTGNMQGNGTVAGANTQIQFNDGGANFGGNAGFTFDKTTGNVDIPGNVNIVGNVFALNLGNANFAANANYANFAGTAFNISGSNVSGQVANALVAGTVYTNAQPNITSLGTLTSLTTGNINVTKIANIVVGLENVNLIPAQTGTYNFDILTSPIQYATANATANLTLNVRGNATTAFSSLIANGQSITVSYALTTGATPYGITSLQIDGSSVTPKYAGSTIFVSNAVTAFTYTIIKNSSSYTVLGSVTRYL